MYRVGTLLVHENIFRLRKAYFFCRMDDLRFNGNKCTCTVFWVERNPSSENQKYSERGLNGTQHATRKKKSPKEILPWGFFKLSGDPAGIRSFFLVFPCFSIIRGANAQILATFSRNFRRFLPPNCHFLRLM